MSASNQDYRNYVSNWLVSGWTVVGYNTQMLAMGNITHFVLLQKESALRSVAVLFDKQRVVGTSVFKLAPGEVEE